MSRDQPEKLTDKETIELYTPKVFGIYARNVLKNKAYKGKDRDPAPEYISPGEINYNGTRVKKIIRLLYENDVLNYFHSGSSPRVNIDTFNKQAPAFAHLDVTEFQLDIETTIINTMSSKNSYSKNNKFLDKSTLDTVGGKNINNINTSSALWAFYNQDKIFFRTPDSITGTFMYLKNREEEVARSVLLQILFHNIRYNPTQYMAEFYGTEWVGKISTMPYIRKHDALTMVKSPLNIVAAEKEIRKHAEHFMAYANMLKHIKDQIRGDRATHVTKFLKFMIDTLLRKAPLNLDKDEFKAILEHAADFTFENLFPKGLTKEQINRVLGQVKG